ncbi:MAG: apolipoprotein N-acyltransferase [Deltaproteobacteria bacterium]|nr:apolipoprotein N-acyltransferase [Deltaproteobacteria bacterium]
MSRLRAFARTYALSTLAGVMYFLSWIGFGLWPLAFFCFVPFLWSIQGDTPRQALKKGLWFGLVTHMGGYTWLVHLFTVFAFFPLPLALVGYVGVCAFQGAILGVFAYVLQHARQRSNWPLVVLLPIALCATEWLYPLLFQSYTGVALYPLLPVVQVADLGGVLLLSAVQAIVNGAFADSLLWNQARAAGTAKGRAPLGSATISLLVLGLSIGYGTLRIRAVDAEQKAAEKMKVGIAQPNVGELELHQNPQASVKTLLDQTAELSGRGAELVVWPEVGFNTRPIDTVMPDAGEWIRRGIPVRLVAGAMRYAPMSKGPRKHDVWNSALMIDLDGKITGSYDKQALLAFGEYIPLGETFPILYQWSPMSAPLSRGTTQAPLVAGKYRLATFICYEDILPGIVNKLMAEGPGGRPHVLVNLTNDSWYGAGNEQEQHLVLAAIRSIEHRRWLVRSTSTGISAFVDAAGRILQRIGKDERAVMVRDVPMLTGTTVYEALGDWPGYLAVVALVSVFLRARRRLA